MDNPLNGKRILIRNIDKTEEIRSVRYLPDGRIGIIFKGLDQEYKYNPANITIYEQNATPQIDEYELANHELIKREQETLNTVIESVYDILNNKVYGHIPFLSPNYKRSRKQAAAPYKNFLKNPYFAKMRFAGDQNSYYISEHNINNFSHELPLPEHIKIISVYSDLGRHIYDRSPTFSARKPLEKLIPIGHKLYRYNIDASMNGSDLIQYNTIEKLRFDIRDGKIKELKDETSR